jgi:hypothetical protein
MDNSKANEAWIDKLVDELVDAKDEVSRLAFYKDSFDTMVRIILNSSRLDYYCKDLTLDSEKTIIEYVKAIYPSSYAARIKELKAEIKASAEAAATEEGSDNG